MPAAVSRLRPVHVYGLIFVVLAAAYPVLPQHGRATVFAVASFAPAPGMALALVRGGRPLRRTWAPVLAGTLWLGVGNVVWAYDVDVHAMPTGGATANYLITIGHLTLLVGALSLIVRSGRNDLGGLIDATIMALALGGLLWDLLLMPHLNAVGASGGREVSVFLDMFTLCGMLGALVRLITTGHRRTAALHYLLVALLASLLGNVAVALLEDPVTSRYPDRVDVLFLIGYGAFGCVALHPSWRRLLAPVPPPRDDLSTGRLILLGLGLVLGPVLGGARQLAGLPVDGVLLAVGSAAVGPLVMLRVGRLARQRARAEQALRHQASHDPLTGLPNRSYFVHRLEASLARGRGTVLLFCDLDGFKAVNDLMGHAAGDELLVEVARRLRACVRDGDVVSRFGGDEFLVICEDTASPGVAAEVCDRIGEAFALPVQLTGGAATVGASVGVVVAAPGDVPDPPAAADALVRRADEAMYAAKTAAKAEAATGPAAVQAMAGPDRPAPPAGPTAGPPTGSPGPLSAGNGRLHVATG